MTNPFWREGFGPFLPDTEAVPFGDLDELTRRLSTRRFAAFILEPLQAESGVLVPTREYLQQAQALCRRHGTLFVLDEVQTGLYRTGPFLAAHHFGVEPDMVVLAKALSGGLVPCGAVLMSDVVCNSVYSSLQRAVIHTSTYSENSLAMRAALATLDVLEDGRLGERAACAGETLRERLAARLAKYEMVGEIRGLGLLNAIEFRAPHRFRLKIPFQAFARIQPAMFGQVVVMRLFRDHRILSQICGNNFMVLKIAPPLIIEDAQLEHYVEAIGKVVDLMHSSASFWSEALQLAGRVVTTI
jgi:ornithine--oxo-acid transaminase